jgi:hypothetical protein
MSYYDQINKICISNGMQYLFWLLTGFLVFIYPFLLIPYGLDFTDSFYQLTLSTGQQKQSESQIHLLVFLYPLLGKVWQLLGPNTLISFRIMGTLLWIVAQVLPIIVILDNLRVRKLTQWALAALAVVIIFFGGRGMGYDLPAALWGGGVFAVTALYLFYGGRYKLILLGLLIAGFVGSRFPSVTVFAPTILVICLKDWIESKRIQEMIISLGVLFISFAGFFLLFYLLFVENAWKGSIGISIIQYFKHLLKILDQMPSSHNSSMLLAKFWRDGEQVLKMLMILFSFIVVWRVISVKKARFGILKVLLTFGLWYYIASNLTGTNYNLNYRLYTNACALVALLGVLYFAYREKDTAWILLGILGFSFGFVSAIGSNTGLMKMLNSYSFILPIAVWYIWKQIQGSDRALVGILLLTLVFFALTEKLFFGTTYEDDKWYRIKSEVNHPQLEGVYTSAKRKAFLEEILGQISEIKSKHPDAKFVYHGRFAWIFRYLDKKADNYNFGFNMLFNDPEETKLLEKYLKQCPPDTYVLLVNGYPEDEQKFDHALVGALLQRKHFSIYAEGVNYQLFAPRGKN